MCQRGHRESLRLICQLLQKKKKSEKLSKSIFPGTQPTNDTLPEEVALSFRGRSAGELPIDFVLDITHRNEGGNNPSPAASLD